MSRKPLVGIGEIRDDADRWSKRPDKPNRLPKPYVEVQADDYYHFASIWTPEALEFDQVLIGNTIRDVRIEWYHNCAFALVWPDKWRCGTNGEPSIVYEEPIRYFRIGCQHELKELGVDECRRRGIDHFGRCWHVQECTKCGLIESYDSSD